MDVEIEDLFHFGELSMLDVGDNLLRDVSLFSGLSNLHELVGCARSQTSEQAIIGAK